MLYIAINLEKPACWKRLCWECRFGNGADGLLRDSVLLMTSVFATLLDTCEPKRPRNVLNSHITVCTTNITNHLLLRSSKQNSSHVYLFAHSVMCLVQGNCSWPVYANDASNIYFSTGPLAQIRLVAFLVVLPLTLWQENIWAYSWRLLSFLRK